MKNFILIFLSCIGFTNCSVISTSKFSGNETLIANQSKIIEHGSFIFLVFENKNEVKELVYLYSIDTKSSKWTCLKMSEKLYRISGKNKYSKDITLRTAEEFKYSQVNSWREKYYACFAADFLDMTNDEKIDLFNSIENK
jgi:hypothetical protein